MRTKRMKKRLSHDTDQERKEYEFVSRSDSNGPMEYMKIHMPMSRVSKVNGLYHNLKKVKPYSSASANGIAVKSTNSSYFTKSGREVIRDVTNSDLIYQVLSTSSQEIAAATSSLSDDKAINGALSSGQKYGDLLLLVSAAEAKKTVSMVRTVFIDLYKFLLEMYKAIKHLKPAKAYEVLSNAWLSYRYGWRPLNLELRTLYEHFTDETNHFAIRSAYGTDKFEKLSQSFMVERPLMIDGQLVDFVHEVTITEATYKFGYNYVNSVDSRNIDTLENLGLSMRSLLQTAHELIPFSFILDMFVNVGDALKTLDFHSNVNPVNGYSTKRYIVDISSESISTDKTGFTETGFRWEVVNEDITQARLAAKVEGIITALRTRNLHSQIPDFPAFVKESELDLHGNKRLSPFAPSWLSDQPIATYLDKYPDMFGVSFVYKRRYYKSEEVILEQHVNMPYPDAFMQEEIGDPIDRAYHQVQAALIFTANVDPDNPDRFKRNGLHDNSYFSTMSYLCGKANIFHGDITFEYVYKDNIRHIIPQFLEIPIDENIYLIPPFTKRVGYNYFIDTIVNECSGEYLVRKEHDEFDFNFVAEIDLSLGQTTDLIIFGERLVTAIVKKLS